MMYSEFVEGTGCRENEHNYKVFQNLEVMYMNTNMSKEEVYEYGKKLVDNSKSEEQIKFENEINEQINSYKAEIKDFKEYIEQGKQYADDPFFKSEIKCYKNQIKYCRNRIKELKWVLA